MLKSSFSPETILDPAVFCRSRPDPRGSAGRPSRAVAGAGARGRGAEAGCAGVPECARLCRGVRVCRGVQVCHVQVCWHVQICHVRVYQAVPCVGVPCATRGFAVPAVPRACTARLGSSRSCRPVFPALGPRPAGAAFSVWSKTQQLPG